MLSKLDNRYCESVNTTCTRGHIGTCKEYISKCSPNYEHSHSFLFAFSALLKPFVHALALSVSHNVVPFCAPCYLKNFVHSVLETHIDPVLQHSLRCDLDIKLCACDRLPACMCHCLHMCVHQRFTMTGLHYLRPVPLLPGFTAHLSSPFGKSLSSLSHQ